MNKRKNLRLLFAITLLALLIGSMFLAILAFQDIRNYDSPKIFVSLIGSIGLIIGFILYKKILPYVLRVIPKTKNNEVLLVSLIFIAAGALLFIGNILNTAVALKARCETYQVIDKYRKEYRYGRSEVNTLVVNIENENRRVICNYDYWVKKEINSRLKLCLFESPFGFSYIRINEM